MIWTDREIKLALEKRTLIIDPPPADEAFASTSVDLTLDPILSEFRKKETDRYFDPGRPGYSLDKILAEETERVDITQGQRYELIPGKLVLAWTAEYIDLRQSPRLAAHADRSTGLDKPAKTGRVAGEESQPEPPCWTGV